jgi:hypothetical protein
MKWSFKEVVSNYRGCLFLSALRLRTQKYLSHNIK